MFTEKLIHLSKSDIAIAGGKGASLGEMTRAGIPVPPGFVVSASAFDLFLEKSGIGVEIEPTLHSVIHNETHSVDQASSRIRNLIQKAEIPASIGKEILAQFSRLNAKFVAVRSSATTEDSATAAWAGQLESYLNVTKKNLLESVKKCWSSLFTQRAIFYRFEKMLRKQSVSVAVVVQKMIQSEASGICFTVHPVTKIRNQMVIEAGYGLGEAIVGGKVTPDTYAVRKDKKESKILDKNISEQRVMIVRGVNGVKEIPVPNVKQGKQKLSDDQILKLAGICSEIERHCRRPQDIEWCLEKGKLYIVQSRPITTL